MGTGSGKQRASKSAEAVVESNGTGPGSQTMIDLDFLRGLIEAVDNSGIDTIEINRAGTKIRIAKSPPPAPMTAMPAVHAGVPAAQLPAVHGAPAAGSATGSAAAAPAAEAPKSNLIDVKSPMVGTFYRAPAPEAPSYAEIGAHVTKGQTLCILEAMKLMNELESEVDGIVREILVDNADPVEFGQVLFRIEPAAR